MTCNHIVCGCQLWEFSNDLDRKEFCVGSLDFVKGRVVLEFIVQLECIAYFKHFKGRFTRSNFCVQLFFSPLFQTTIGRVNTNF